MYTDTKKTKEPIDLLNEIEQFICFRMGAENPTINEDEMKAIRESILFCIDENKEIVKIDSTFFIKK